MIYLNSNNRQVPQHTEMFSSTPSSLIKPRQYDVFLSFRGEDTRKGFTSHLHKGLRQKEIETVMDNELQRGDEISPTLLTAIEESKISVIIFSRNYASSKWCLDELEKIMDCKKRNEHYYVVPVFYRIDPSEVRNQRGSFAEAFANHEEKFKHNIQRVKAWRTALTEAANLFGWDTQVTMDESTLVDEIVNDTLKKLNHGTSSCLEGLVGIERRMEQVTSLLRVELPDFRKNNRSYQFLSELRQSEPSQKIKGRVARMWDSVILPAENKVVSTVLLLVDENGNAMQALIEKKDQDLFKPILKESSIYEISDFYVGKTKTSFNAIPGEQIINFNRCTKVTKITNPTVPYQLNYFEFQDFPSLPSRVNNNSLLTDVIGVLIAMGPVLKVYTKDKAVVERRKIKLRDLHGNKLNVTLWAAHARTLGREKLVEKQANVVLIFAGMTVSEYQGMTNLDSSSATKMYIDLPIPETKRLKKRYEDQRLLFHTLDDPVQPRRTGTGGINKNRMTVDQLMRLNLEKSMDMIFTCKATIASIDMTNGWYYNSCNQCSKGLKPINDKLCCPNSGHGEQRPKLTCKLSMIVKDNTGEADFIAFGEIGEDLIGKTITQMAAMEDLDRWTLPTAVEPLIGQERVFKIKLTKQAVDSGKPRFAINKTYFDKEEQAISLATSLVDIDLQQSAESIWPVHGAQAISKVVNNTPADLFPEESPIKQKGIRREKGTGISNSDTAGGDDPDAHDFPLKKRKHRIQEPAMTLPSNVIDVATVSAQTSGRNPFKPCKRHKSFQC